MACVEAEVPIPVEVDRFFGGEDPTEGGREIDISAAVTEYGAEGRSGFEVELAKLPRKCKTLRFYNAW